MKMKKLEEILLKFGAIQTIKILALNILIFWVFIVIYQLIDPMPLPKNLFLIAYILIGVAFFNAVIFAIPLKSLLKNQPITKH